jgi:uncharacterized protein YhdP
VGLGSALDSQQAKGSASLPDAKGAPIAVNLQYVRLPAPDPTVQADENSPDPLASVDPTKIPALDITINQLFLGADLVGGWSLKVRPTAKGIALNNMDMGLKGILLQGNGGWEGPGRPTAGTRAGSAARTSPMCSRAGASRRA